MEKIPQSPKRMPKFTGENMIIQKEYSYSDVVNFKIKSDEIAFITISKNDLIYNLDLLKSLLFKNKNINIKFLDWESASYIDTNINSKIDNKCYLVDDGLRISREYIDLSNLHNIKLVIPFNYLMWGIKFMDIVDTYCFQIKNQQGNYLNLTSINGNNRLTKRDLENIRKKVIELSSFGKLSDSEKILLISDFIQSRTQYIDSIESKSSRGTFITPDFPEFIVQMKKSGLVETVFNENNGVCMGISNLCTLLLNNPEFNMEVESEWGCSHVWNRVLIDGKYYYFDNTWNITRTSDPCIDGLITLSFCNKYNLFGKQTALNIGHHVPETTPIYSNGVLSEEDYQAMQYKSKFEYFIQPLYKSYKK